MCVCPSKARTFKVSKDIVARLAVVSLVLMFGLRVGSAHVKLL